MGELVTKGAMLDKDSDGDGQLTPEESWGTEAAAEDLAVTEEEAIDFRRLDADGNEARSSGARGLGVRKFPHGGGNAEALRACRQGQRHAHHGRRAGCRQGDNRW